MNWYSSSNFVSPLSAITRGGLLQISWDPIVIRSIMDTAYPINLWQSEKANRPDITTFFKLWKLIPNVHFTCLSPSWVCEPSLEPLQTGEINSLEDVQIFALRMCAKHWDSSYDNLSVESSGMVNFQKWMIFDLSVSCLLVTKIIDDLCHHILDVYLMSTISSECWWFVSPYFGCLFNEYNLILMWMICVTIVWMFV